MKQFTCLAMPVCEWRYVFLFQYWFFSAFICKQSKMFFLVLGFLLFLFRFFFCNHISTELNCEPHSVHTWEPHVVQTLNAFFCRTQKKMHWGMFQLFLSTQCNSVWSKTALNLVYIGKKITKDIFFCLLQNKIKEKIHGGKEIMTAF